MRRFLLLTVILSLAFAPAPLPKRERSARPPAITPDLLQGTWRVTDWSVANGVPEPYRAATHVRVTGGRWEFLADGRVFRCHGFRVDASPDTAALTFSRDGDKTGTYGVGLIRREGKALRLMYRLGTEATGPLTFDPPPGSPWVVRIITLQRGE